MKILTAQQFRELDEYTVRQEGISSLELMERAARCVAEEILTTWTSDTPIVIFAGPGNNGGDALAVARILFEQGYQPEVFLFNTTQHLSEDCAANRDRLQAIDGINFKEITSTFEPPQLTAQHLIIDGLFGTGLSRPLNGGFASLVKFINAAPGTVVSIDLPSGLMCEDNTYNIQNHIVCADLTLTFQLPKLALLLADNQKFVGRFKLLDIGLSEEKTAMLSSDFQITERAEVVKLLKPRNPYGHKGIFGHALLIAGKFGMAGAAVLAAKSCLRSGVGKVTLHTPLRNNDILQISVPEAILSHDSSETIFTSPVNTTDFDAAAIGPGIGTEQKTAIAFIGQVSHTQIPLLIDADGINILAGHKGWMQQIPQRSILTPHIGELKRLGNHSVDAYSALMEARELAVRHKIFVVLKGRFTAICTPDGLTRFNPTGNSGMATAGSGDVLTGLITGLLAQGYGQEEACVLGVYLHGLAGDIAAERLGKESLTASDIIDCLPQAFLTLHET